MGCSQSIGEQDKEIKQNESKQEMMRKKNKNQLSAQTKSKECSCKNSTRKNENKYSMEKRQSKISKENVRCENCRSNNPPQQQGCNSKQSIKSKSEIGNCSKKQKQTQIKQNDQVFNAKQKALIKQAQALTQSKCNFQQDGRNEKQRHQGKEVNSSNRQLKSKKKYPDPIRKELKRVYDL